MDLVWGDRTMVAVDGVGVHVERAGPAGRLDHRPTLALLHGFASGTFTWAGVAPAWAPDHRLVAWDRPPFGRSDRPRPLDGPDDPYAPATEVRRSVAVVGAEVGGGGVVLVGHSAGALLAVQITLAGALPVRGLVLVAPALDGAPPALVRRLAGLPGAAGVGGAVLQLAVFGAEPALKAVSRHRGPITDATARESARQLRRPGTGAALFHLTSTWTPPTELDRLGEITVPSMVIGGTDDRIGSPASQGAVARQLGAELHLLDGVGHAAHEQVPEVVAPLVHDFVESIA